jgi:hypothetical protein
VKPVFFGSVSIRSPGSDLAPLEGMALEILIGRSLAFCLHPSAAWRVLSPARRLLLVGAYAGAGYISVLTVLLLR